MIEPNHDKIHGQEWTHNHNQRVGPELTTFINNLILYFNFFKSSL